MKNASVHVNNKYRSTAREFDTMEVVVDEKVNSKEDVHLLDIRVGDIVCFDPRTVLTEVVI